VDGDGGPRDETCDAVIFSQAPCREQPSRWREGRAVVGRDQLGDGQSGEGDGDDRRVPCVVVAHGEVDRGGGGATVICARDAGVVTSSRGDGLGEALPRRTMVATGDGGR